MTDKCKPKYKNLNHIQGFGDQYYAVSKLFEQICSNDEYLKQALEKVSYLTAPAVRLRNKFLPIDDEQSWGHAISKEGNIIFDEGGNLPPIEIDISNTTLIDQEKTDCDFDNYDNNGADYARAIVPRVEVDNLPDEEKYFTDTKHTYGMAANSYWPVCFDKNVPYFIKEDWVKNHKHMRIPGVGRAQTFTIAEGEEGLLESVTLLLQNTGELSHQWSSPLYVQIWPVEEKTHYVTEWDESKKQAVYVIDQNTGKRKTEKIKEPKVRDAKGRQMIYHPLAESVYYPEKTIPHWQSFVFDQPLKVSAGESYAIVVFSPLSHPDHCPRLGGWGRNCTHVKYDKGDAFLSEDNCRSFTRYGRGDKNVPYKFGKHIPQDFAFQCRIKKIINEYKTEGEYYLYLKPIFTNPIIDFQISGEVSGETQGQTQREHVFLELEYSTDGRNWNPTRNGEHKIFNENRPRKLFVRVKMSTDNPDDTPHVENLTIDLITEPAMDLYVRTHYCHPEKFTPMLGASHWGRVYAPFEISPNNQITNGSVEIIEEKLLTQHFYIVSVSELSRFLDKEVDGEKILDESEIVGENITDDDRCRYLVNNPSILTALKQENIYIKPYTLNGTKYYLSFDGGVDGGGNQLIAGLKFNYSPASPIQSCRTEPFGNVMKQAFGEWYDYVVDYSNDLLIFHETIKDGEGNTIDFLDWLPDGTVVVEYNPVFAQDLTINEIGDHVNEETGLTEQGFLLDYQKETIRIDSSIVETRRVPLRVLPLDPIREVILNKDQDNEKELVEDIDFTVDYIAKELVFPIVEDITQRSILKENDTIDVVYTPNLENTGIAIGYRFNRSNLSGQCSIKPTRFLEYKV